MNGDYLVIDKKVLPEVFEKAINTFGETPQKIVAMEEMGELIQAISKDLRGKEHNVEEEIADVEIMLQQMKETTYTDEKLFDFFKEDKSPV